jgi:membrane protease YdiL (CAAX protease family)
MDAHGLEVARVPGTRALVLLAGGLTGYNAALNLVPFPPAVYVPANLALAGAGVWLGRSHGLTWEELGLERARRRGVLAGLGMFAVVGGALTAASRVPALAPLLSDERAAGLSGWTLLYASAIRIPLGTVIPEEVLFRGVALALLRRRMGWWSAAGWSSAAFALWHIGPTVVLARLNVEEPSPTLVAGMVGAAMGLTFVAGVLFCLLRRWGGGLLPPVLTHVATNSLSLLAAVAAQRV